MVDRKTDQRIRRFVVNEICPVTKKPQSVGEITAVESGITLIRRFLESERKDTKPED